MKGHGAMKTPPTAPVNSLTEHADLFQKDRKKVPQTRRFCL